MVNVQYGIYLGYRDGNITDLSFRSWPHMDANLNIITVAISSYCIVDNIVHAPLASKCLTQAVWFDRYKHEGFISMTIW